MTTQSEAFLNTSLSGRTADEKRNVFSLIE